MPLPGNLALFRRAASEGHYGGLGLKVEGPGVKVWGSVLSAEDSGFRV